MKGIVFGLMLVLMVPALALADIDSETYGATNSIFYDVRGFDYIFYYPHLLSEFGRVEKEDKLVNPDIPDPIGKSLEFYRKVFNIIKESVVRTVQILEKQNC